jgi:hypothetical protein
VPEYLESTFFSLSRHRALARFGRACRDAVFVGVFVFGLFADFHAALAAACAVVERFFIPLLLALVLKPHLRFAFRFVLLLFVMERFAG